MRYKSMVAGGLQSDFCIQMLLQSIVIYSCGTKILESKISMWEGM